MKQAILNADDFGMTKGINEGIIRAHREGVLTSTTLMANGPAFEDAVARAKEDPGLGVGCHLVLVGGQAVAPADTISSLAAPDGQLPRSLAGFVMRLSLGLVRMKHVEAELRAQIDKLRAAGIEPSHLDTHKHTHAHPRVMEALAHVADSCGIRRVRRPAETLRDSWRTSAETGRRNWPQIAAAGGVRGMAPCFAALCEKYGLRAPDRFLGIAATGQLNPDALGRVIKHLREGQTEIMLHPGVCDEELRQTGSRLQGQREKELAALIDPGVKSALAEHGVRLITYRELN